MVSMGEDGFHQAPIAAAKPANPVNPTHNRNQTIILPPFPPTTTKQKIKQTKFNQKQKIKTRSFFSL
jgi:predicted glycosyltransferase